MSQLIVNKEIFNLGGKFWVTDENDNQKYQIVGSFLKVPKHFTIYDNLGNERGKVTHQLVALLPKFSLELDGQPVATISKKISLLKPKYEVDAKNVKVVGNLLDMNFEISQNGQTIGRIDKKWFSLHDRYQIEVLDPQDELLVLGLVLAINYVKAEDDNN